MNVVILAAGRGKRMQSALPKVLHTLAGAPLLAHVIATARDLKPAAICVVYGHGGEQVPEAMRAADLMFVKQDPQLGTGHALQQALPHLDARKATLVLYGDVPLTAASTLDELVVGSGERLRILTAELENPHGYGRIVRNAKGAITAVVEEKDATDKQRHIREINTGIMLLPGKRLAAWLERLSNRNAQREYYLTDIVALAVKDRVKIESSAPGNSWEILGVNSMRQLADLERLHQSHNAARLLEAGVALADPARIDVRGTLSCGRDVRVDVNCIFEGAVEIGDNAVIGANCVIRNATIGAATRIEPFSTIDDAVIGKNCRVGPYARIRPGTTLAADVHIGNFVEVKASNVGAGSKANHLAYVGDTSIGRNVNVGAGTITCNYDGVNKHRTVIEDDVLIGSDVQLVAPVTVHAGATIGAGATITKDVPAGELTYTEKKQVTRQGWKRPSKITKR
ncbi:MAG: bifunctional UDP-N-acetylglucosamine diphosphorylase/glucosamine-1-phosphate N-acetyltransferase GlmU [Burkholderiales bacterium]